MRSAREATSVSITAPTSAPATAPSSDGGGRQLAALWAVAAVALLALAPFGELLAAALPACPVKTLTGVPCPSCGATRAAQALAELRVVEAFVRYPALTLAWVGFLGGGLVAGALALTGRGLPRLPNVPPWGRGLLVVLVLAHWAYSIATGV